MTIVYCLSHLLDEKVYRSRDLGSWQTFSKCLSAKMSTVDLWTTQVWTGGSIYTVFSVVNTMHCMIHGWLNLKIQNSGFEGPTVSCCSFLEEVVPLIPELFKGQYNLELDQSTWNLQHTVVEHNGVPLPSCRKFYFSFYIELLLGL